MCKGDCTPNVPIDQFFLTHAVLIKWVQRVSYDLGFVVVIVRSNKYNGQTGRKTYSGYHIIHPLLPWGKSVVIVLF